MVQSDSFAAYSPLEKNEGGNSSGIIVADPTNYDVEFLYLQKDFEWEVEKSDIVSQRLKTAIANKVVIVIGLKCEACLNKHLF